VADVVDHHAEAFERAHAKQTEIALLGENDLINGSVTLGSIACWGWNKYGQASPPAP
jgi:hypothetical protein